VKTRPHPNHQGKCGCQDYVDDKGVEWECPFKESLKMKEIFDSTRRLGRHSEIDAKFGFLSMYTLDHNDPLLKIFCFAQQQSGSSAEWLSKFMEEMNDSTLRCHGCHRFKTILCGDTVYFIPLNATVLITEEDDMQDPALIITDEDDFLSTV
jgi:hypothetical protein